MILLIDNYDSFSYNLYQLIGGINPDIKVIRNDEMSVAQIRALAPEYIVLSPGPKSPKDAGVCVDGSSANIQKFSAFALGINQYAWRMAQKSLMQKNLCTANKACAALIIIRFFLRDCQIKLKWHAIIHLRRMKAQCRSALELRQKQMMAKLWRCSTAACLFTGFNFTPNLF